jgi:N-acetylmuramoyl-L-alanine amidase
MRGKVLAIATMLLVSGMMHSLPLLGAERSPGRHLVVIDAAHGGTDKGVKISEKEYEKDVTLKIALIMKDELAKTGNIQMQLTRLSDVDMSIAQRVKAVQNVKAHLFISLHVNAGFGKDAAGYEVYFPGFQGDKAQGSSTADILSDMTKNKYLNDSVALAQTIMGNLQKIFPRKGRGLRGVPIPVLEGLALPAVVVELGFSTNKEDRAILIDDKGCRAIAQALSRSVKEFFP